MSERQTERFLGGGLNVLAPGDLLPAEDAMEVLNWRADQAGQLRSRKRETAIDANTYDTPIHTAFFQDILLPWRYTGGGSKIYRNEVELANGFDGAHLGLVNWDRQLWVMNRAASGRISADDAQLWPWLPSPATVAPTVAAGAGTGLTGDYQYFVTFDTLEGYESDLSTSYASITLANQSADLTNIPVSADATVTARHIYRQGGYQDALYRIGTLPDNTTTIFSDTMTDEDAARVGISHEGDHGSPPACRGLAGMYYGRMLAFSSAEHPNWFWWTPSGKPWYWPGSDLDEGNHAPVGEDGEELLACSIKPRMVLFYARRSIWRMIGDPDDASGRLEQIEPFGIVGPCAWASDGNTDYIGGPEGVYAVNGESARKVSPKLDPIFKGDGNSLNAFGVKPMNQEPAVRALTVLAMRNGRLYVSYADNEHTAPNVTLILNTETGAWYRDDRGFTALCDQGDTLIGAIGNQLFTVEGGGTQALTLAYQSRFTDQGAPENLKMYSDLVVEHDTGGVALQVNALYDRGTSGEILGFINSNGWASTVFPINTSGREGRNFALRIDGAAGAADVFLFSAHLHYYVTARLARSYDSEAQDLGPKTHQLAQLGADIETGSADVTWHFSCDQGGVLAEVDSGVIATAAGRQRPIMPFDRQYEGRLVRVVLTSPQPFRLYGVSLWARPIGLWLPAGTTFTLPPADFGVKRQKLYQQLALDLDGSIRLAAQTDTPGDRMAERASADLTHAGAGWATLAMPPRSRGRLLVLTFTALTDTRIYGGRVRVKPLGEASAAWSWSPLPIEPTPAEFTWTTLPVKK